jgi:hypothetical protein
VRWCTKLTEVTEDSKGSNSSLTRHLALDTDNRWTGSEIFHERLQMAGAKHKPQPRDVRYQRRLSKADIWSAERAGHTQPAWNFWSASAGNCLNKTNTTRDSDKLWTYSALP